MPAFPTAAWRDDVEEYARVTRAEGEYIEAVRREVSPLLANVPTGVDDFIDWFEELKRTGPGQGDQLFPWLARNASREDMLWFLTQEVAGEAGFDDLLAMTQVKMPVTAKLRWLETIGTKWAEAGKRPCMARSWRRLANYLEIDAKPEHVIPESLALGNAMLALARSRRYCFQSIGALGVIEMTAPTRACFVDAGLKRLRIPTKKATLLHSACCSRHQTFRVLEPRSFALPCRAGAALRPSHR